MKILYRSHIENLDWTEWKNDGEVSGTVGKGLRLEAIQIKLEELNGLDIRMEYQAHCENYGWMELKTDGETAGTVGEGLRLEALRIRLVGADAHKYQVKYKIHIENEGWLLWNTDGETAGTVHRALRAEAIEIRLVALKPDEIVPDDIIEETDPFTGEPILNPDTGIPFGQELMVKYQTHSENIGWSKETGGGLLSGTVGIGLRMEAIRIGLINTGNLDLGISYQTHIQNIGWQPVKYNNETAGTTDQALQLEAIRINLTGSDASEYSVWYSVHIENEGWQDWRRDGEVAGTTGQFLRAEAIYILIAKKDKNLSRIPKLEPTMSVNYRSHIQNRDWGIWAKNGQKSGTTGLGLRMEAFEMKLTALDNINLGLRYNAHLENIGWQGWKIENQVAGTTGESRRLEAIKIELTGADADKYTIQYRVHSENYGWSKWAKNGEIAGTTGEALRMEAMSVVIVKKFISPQTITNEIKNKMPYYQVFATEFPDKEYLLHDIRTDHKLSELTLIKGENNVDRLSFMIDPTHQYFNVIKELRTNIIVYAEYANNRVEKIFEGRALSGKKNYENLRRYVCEGELGYLIDGIQRPAKYENQTVEEWLTNVLDKHNRQVTADRRFYMGIVTKADTKLDALRENDYTNTLDLLQTGLLAELGGYLQIEQIGGFRFLNYLENYGQVSTQVIEFGKNLLDLEHTINTADIVTALVPVGKVIDDKKLNIATVNNNSDYVYNNILVNRYGWIFGFKEWPEIEDAETLKQKGIEFLEFIASRGISITLTAIDLSLINVDIDEIKIGDALQCISRPHGLDTFMVVSQKTQNLGDPSQDKIVVGDQAIGITGRIAGGIISGGGVKIMGGSSKPKTELEETIINTIKNEETIKDELSNELEMVIDNTTDEKIVQTVRNSPAYQADFDGIFDNQQIYDIVDRVTVVEQYVTPEAIVNAVTASTEYIGMFETKADKSTVEILASRVNTAEQKITADAITSTVTQSTTYIADLGGKTNIDDFLPVVTRLDEAEQKITPTAITNTVRSSGDYIADLENKADGSVVSAIVDRVTLAESKITSEAITNTVRSSTQYQSDLDGKVGDSEFNSLFNRVSVAESKITAEAITNTVTGSQTYLLDLSKKVGTTEFNQVVTRVYNAEQKITDSAIVSTVRSSGLYVADLNNKADNSTVSALVNRVSTAEQKITDTAIVNTVTGSYKYVSDLNGKASSTDMTSAFNRIYTAEQKITDSAIVSTVRGNYYYQNDLNGKVTSSQIISTINQSAESIKISANKVNITGFVTFANLSNAGQTTINGGNITTGSISATRIQGGSLNFKNILATNRLSIQSADYTAGVDMLSGNGKKGSVYANDQRGLNLYSQSGGILLDISYGEALDIGQRSVVNANNLPLTSTSSANKIKSINWRSTYFEIETSYGAKGITVWDCDKRLKKNIKTSQTKSLDIVNKIKTREFEWLDTGNKEYCGFVAQEIENDIGGKFVLKVKQKDGSETYQLVAQEFIPLLTKAIQEMSLEIDKLKKERGKNEKL